MRLRYVGGGAFLPNVPARDLSQAALVRLAESFGEPVDALVERLVASGLYRKIEAAPSLARERRKPRETE